MKPPEERIAQRPKGPKEESISPHRLRAFVPSCELLSARAFTLVELIVVMAVLALVLAFSAPSLARSMRQRNLAAEAARFLAATEHARDEAVSQAVPMVVWIDEKTRSFGIEAKSGFLGDATRERTFTVHPDVEIALEKTIGRNAKVQPIEFASDGAPATTNVETVELKDRFASTMTIARTADGWGYEILKEAK
jgi:prepilin-type N-terminal cleavage/methylation domain-containing protein